MWNPSRWDCECNKACKIDEHLDIENCSCGSIQEKTFITYHNASNKWKEILILIMWFKNG